MRKTSYAQIRDGILVFAILVGFIAIVRPAIVSAQGTGSGQLCIQNMQQLQQAVGIYAEDYDLVLPPFHSPAELAKRIQPFTKTSAAYLLRCPVMQRPYWLNLSISGKVSVGAEILAQDSVPHTDGKSTVGFVNGSITYGGINPALADPNAACLSNAKKVGLACVMYVQDYDEVFPTYRSYAEFQSCLLPYSHSNTIFTCPATKLPYVVNKSLSGRPEGLIVAPAATKLLQDARPHLNGKITTAFADGHAVQLGQ